MPLSRRSFVLLAALTATGTRTAAAAAAPGPGPATAGVRGAALADLERRHGGRLGVAIVDLGRPGAPVTGHRADERFALCSTFKLMLAAAVLVQADAGRWRLDERLRWRAADAVPHMPVAEGRDPQAGLTLGELAEAAQVLSDNLAANLLLRHLGGPAAFTVWLRSQGDTVTRLDRYEPHLNGVGPGDERDTSTPAAMVANLRRVLDGPMLRPDSRRRLLDWMRATRTGQHRLRAGLPAGWTGGDKTGTGYGPGQPDRLNDLAICWPPGAGAPRLVAAFYEGPRQNSPRIRPQDEAVLAAVGRLAAA